MRQAFDRKPLKTNANFYYNDQLSHLSYAFDLWYVFASYTSDAFCPHAKLRSPHIHLACIRGSPKEC